MIGETTSNAYLDGRVTIRQPAKGYRAGVDPVLLAASVPARAGQSVLELGCGVGTASLCLGHRVTGLRLEAVELQPDYAALAQENAEANGQNMAIHLGDLAKLPDVLKQQRFDHVIANPPYFDRRSSTAAEDPGRETAMGEDTPLAVWVDVAARRLKPRGYASFIHRAERLPDILSAMQGRLGSIEVLPLQARTTKPAGLILVRARKEGRADFRLHAPVAMHSGDRHAGDAESYTPRIRAVLRDGDALAFGE
ncbi:tRNA1(Val) (adenine(37)-N6)-methyltransferase [Shimia sediminis]|uniref:tRNA1(Val) (adenine(37)-N6)-methyltransferase n=1 Tax=Shimia sediminis TaxID=2497945 RepID=UPI000F8CDCD1|nr:methyltransferase [Shimia sediminis]